MMRLKILMVFSSDCPGTYLSWLFKQKSHLDDVVSVYECDGIGIYTVNSGGDYKLCIRKSAVFLWCFHLHTVRVVRLWPCLSVDYTWLLDYVYQWKKLSEPCGNGLAVNCGCVWIDWIDSGWLTLSHSKNAAHSLNVERSNRSWPPIIWTSTTRQKKQFHFLNQPKSLIGRQTSWQSLKKMTSFQRDP